MKTRIIAKNLAEPMIRMFLTQATYERIISKYFSMREKDNWEKRFTDEGTHKRIIDEFIGEIERKANKSISALIRELSDNVTDDIADIVIRPMFEAVVDQSQLQQQ